MASDTETIADIEAEMRVYDPSSEGDALRMFADRLKAARKRELPSKNADSDNGGSAVASGGECGNAAKLREALWGVVSMWEIFREGMEYEFDGHYPEGWISRCDDLEKRIKAANAARTASSVRCPLLSVKYCITTSCPPS